MNHQHKIKHLIIALGSALLLLAGLLLTVGLIPARPARAGGVIYVDAGAPGPTYNGASWTTAYTTVQDALAAATSGDEIWVAEGVYYPDEGAGQTNNDRSSTFQLKSGVALYGGFAATETLRAQRNWSAHLTVLSGDLDQNDTADANGVITNTANITGANAYHVIVGSNANNTAILDGFTITAGRANKVSNNHDNGGGMYTNPGGPTLAHITFYGNFAKSNGGAIYNNSFYGYSGDMTIMTDVTFIANRALFMGGAISNNNGDITMTGVTFITNRSDYGGGGMASLNGSPVLSNVTFSDNQAKIGGGMYNKYGNPALTQVTFTGNIATAHGGGMYNENSNPLLTQVTFFNNNASPSITYSSGGGMYNFESSPALTYTTFISNASSHGGGMFVDGNSNPVLTEVTFRNNTAKYGGGLDSSPTASGLRPSPVLKGVTFTLNSAAENGGGVYNGYKITLDRVMFISNTAGTDGGGLYNWLQVNITNTLFSGNHASDSGGGIYNSYSSKSTLVNVTFSGNIAGSYGGGIRSYLATTKLTNSVLWNNTAAGNNNQIDKLGGRLTINHSLVQGSGGSGAGWDTNLGTDGGGNIDADPLFVDADGPDNIAGTDDDDLRLQETSPAIDAGDNSALPAGGFDLDNQPRFVDSPTVVDTGSGTAPIVDMGAYEVQVALSNNSTVYLPVVIK